MIGRQVAHLVRLIDDLLDLSRIRSGKIVLQDERIDLRTLVNEAIEAAQPQYASFEQELSWQLPPQPLHVRADPTRIAQVVANLLHNASKFTPRGGRIAIVLRREGDEAVIRVRDNGQGIPPEKLASVFGMFAQLEQAGHHSQGGLGLGLHLSRSLVELHRGTIEAHSEGLRRDPLKRPIRPSFLL
jgi:signal transduction histidine kinase